MIHEPKIYLTHDQHGQLLAYVPHWNAEIHGPVPFGSLERALVTIECVVRETYEEALDVIETHILNLCEMWNHDYDEDEWDIVSLALSDNAN